MAQIIRDILPERIVHIIGNIENAQTLLVPKTKQIGIGAEEFAVLSPGSAIILDFGREIVGGARILAFSESAVPARLRFGESVAETCAELGEKNATNDHALRDFPLTVPMYSDGVYGSTGFRFLRIDAAGELKLKNVYAHDHAEDLVCRGSFECNDGRVNEIYNVARETLFTCVQNGYIWDGVKRDRLVWIGDLHPEMMGLLCTVGETETVERCLRLAVEQTPLPDWMNGIPAYSHWWIVNLHDYIAHTGKFSLAEEFASYLRGIMEQTEPLIDDDGTTHLPYDFLDWPTHGQGDELAGQTGLLLLAAQKAQALLRRLGDSAPADRILAKLGRHRATVALSKQAQAMRTLAGFAPAQELLLRGGSRGISTFMSYYILRAIAEGGDGTSALTFMKEYYGGMLDRGARTFWEDFSVDWLAGSGRIDALPAAGERDIHGDYGAFCYVGFRHSLCHGWSCGPVPFLTHVVLGIRILEEGCKKVAVCPDLCGLTHARGSYPTPYGLLTVEHTVQADGTLKTTVHAPAEVEVVQTHARGLIC